jgi:hypothetical protein
MVTTAVNLHQILSLQYTTISVILRIQINTSFEKHLMSLYTLEGKLESYQEKRV